MTLVNRWYQILQLLVTRKEVTIHEIQEEIKASPQTVKKSIDSLNEELAGIAKVVFEDKKAQLKIISFDSFDEVMAGKLKQESDYNSASKRIAYVIKRLVEAENFVLIDDISYEMAVSRGTVVNDLKSLKKILKVYDVNIVGTPNKGLRIIGKEVDLRLLLLNYGHVYFPETILLPQTTQLIAQFSSKKKLTKHDSTLLKRVVDIVLLRILMGHPINNDLPHYIGSGYQSSLLAQLIYHIEMVYQVSLSQYEQDFIGFPLNINTGEKTKKMLVDEEKLKRYFMIMMEAIHKIKIVSFDEEELFQEMKIHLMHMINRLVFRVELNDFFYGEIEKNYPFAYELAKISLQELAKYLKRSVPSAEISYLSLYFELILRNQTKRKQPKEIAIVCSTGRGTALIIRRQLEKVLGPELNIVEYSEEAYEKQDLNQYFAVFTTIPLKNIHEETPVIHLTHLFDDLWLQNEWQKASFRRLTGFDTVIFKFQQLRAIDGYQKNLKKMIAQLRQEQLVDQMFEARIFEREKKQLTILSKGIAFPHEINKSSDQIILSIGTFPLGETLEEKTIESIFLLAIPEKTTEKNETELLELFDNIFQLFGQKEFREQVRALSDLESFLALLKRKETSF